MKKNIKNKKAAIDQAKLIELMTVDQRKILRVWILLTANGSILGRIDPANQKDLETAADTLGIHAGDGMRDKVIDLIKWSFNADPNDPIANPVPQTIAAFFAQLQGKFKGSFNSSATDQWPPDGGDHPGIVEVSQILHL